MDCTVKKIGGIEYVRADTAIEYLMPCPIPGLYRKFIVARTDGRSGRGQKHERCDYLVLDWVHDPYAVPAGLAYADACEAEYPELAADIRIRAGNTERHAAIGRAPSRRGRGA